MNYYLPLINLMACIVIAVISICRLRLDICADNKWIRARYALFVGGACGCGLQPMFFGSIPSAGTCIMSCAVMLTMVIDYIRFSLKGSNETCAIY